LFIQHNYIIPTVTSDVQDAEMCSRDNTIVIHCIFISGSTVNGCGFTLVGVVNVTGYSARTKSIGDIVIIEASSSYSSIWLYDASNRSDFSNADIGIERSFPSNLMECPTTNVTGNIISWLLNYEVDNIELSFYWQATEAI